MKMTELLTAKGVFCENENGVMPEETNMNDCISDFLHGLRRQRVFSCIAGAQQ